MGVGPHLAAAAHKVLHLASVTPIQPLRVEQRLHGWLGRGDTDQVKAGLLPKCADTFGRHVTC